MAEASMRAYRRTLDLATALVDGMNSQGYETVVATQLNDCLGGDLTVFFDQSRISVGIPNDVTKVPWHGHHQECQSVHPLEHAYAVDRNYVPLAVSDVVEESAWRRHPSYFFAQRELDNSTRQLAIPLPSPRGLATAFLVCRSGRDFTQRERTFSRSVHPLINAIFRHIAEVRRLERRVQKAPDYDPRPDRTELGLTPRELAVLGLSAEGLTAAAIARRLGISPHTINKHLENAYRKCGTRDRLTTVLLVRELGLIPSGHSAGNQ